MFDGRHVNQITARERDVRSNARALLGNRLFGNLHQNLLAFAQEIGDCRLRALAPCGAAVATAGRSTTTIARSYCRDFPGWGRLFGLFDCSLGSLNRKWVIGHLRQLSLERIARHLCVVAMIVISVHFVALDGSRRLFRATASPSTASGGELFMRASAGDACFRVGRIFFFRSFRLLCLDGFFFLLCFEEPDDDAGFFSAPAA